MTDPKPCPFCGSAPVPYGTQNTEVRHQRGTHCVLEDRAYWIKSWNRRVPRFSPDEREALEAARQSLEVHTQELQDPIDDCPECEAAAVIRKMLEEK